MIDAWLLILMIVIPFVLFVGNGYLIIYFQHPDDKLTAWGPKIVTLIALMACEIFVLLLPLDVANSGPPVKDVPMSVLWMIFIIVLAALALIVLPFCIFYYEAQDLEQKFFKQVRSGIIAVCVILFAFFVLFFLLWIFIGVADVKTAKLTSTSTLVTMDAWNVLDTSTITVPDYESKFFNMTFRVSPVLFLVTLFSLIGFLILICFGGIGLAAIPFDLISDFKHRPKRISLSAFEAGKKEINKRCPPLIKLGEDLKKKRREVGLKNRKHREKVAAFKQSVLILDRDYRQLVDSFELKPGAIIFAYVKLVLGFLAAALSILWILQIALYMPMRNYIANPLGAIVEGLNNAWGMLGTIAYGIVMFYLLVCVFKGIIKCGMRILFVPLYPIEMSNTTMSSFLFNAILLVISSYTVVHFSTLAFASFVQETAVSVVFDLSVSNLRGLKYFFRYVPYGLLGVPIIALIILFILPRKETPAIDFDQDLIMLKSAK